MHNTHLRQKLLYKMRVVGSAYGVSILLILLLFGVYLTTLCPTIYLGDSGELAAAAFSLGIPHNSGYPLYTLIGKCFCLIPLGNIGFRVNLMSAFFAVLTVWLVFTLIHKMTSSILSAFSGALVLGFTPVLWLQAVSAEVYTLHAFFVILLIRVLWWWDERKEFFRLLLIVFITGLSFGNHMQTVLLGPAVLFFLLTGDRKLLWRGKDFVLIAFFFFLPLVIYLYLPVRTEAGAAIHWGDPNTLHNFVEVVFARAHRKGYVFNMTPWEYVTRGKEAVLFTGSQLGVFLLPAAWGWIKLKTLRWRVFFAVIVCFDLIYTVFLNTISLEITPFMLPSCIVVAILVGVGLSSILKKSNESHGVGYKIKGALRMTCLMFPLLVLFSNFPFCDQSRNYTAYEYAVNILRTLRDGDILFMDGDNHLFPIAYGRVVEGMGEDLLLYDRQNILFKIPYLGDSLTKTLVGTWNDVRGILEGDIIRKTMPSGIYYAVFDPQSVKVPDPFTLIPYCLIHRVVPRKESRGSYKIRDEWRYYSTESFYEDFERDYMNRQVTAHFYLRLGQYLFMAGKPDLGFQATQKSSLIGYNDTGIHGAIAVSHTDRGLFREALRELEKMNIHQKDQSLAQNAWGYYYFRTEDYRNAAQSFETATRFAPGNHIYFRNFAHALFMSGRTDEAVYAFRKSLALEMDQPDIERFMTEHNLR